MIQITDAAAEHLKELVATEGAGKDGLRIRVEKGGCAGLQYNMLLDVGCASDEVVSAGGVRVFLDAEGGG